ncbi:NADH dehydrogenase [ubiquinone] 1 alpha subcomplex assembly factor 3 [Orchesella cincta]|uniref:NADH dehydrogenase [ubiquinone] 1 alpha subcomplex assembly factor 3 n=1 Tax=Orchesella cincta TaxID=48709 RepID=A0A1D2NGN4_ORCCI|nr:NADH dehydrogenase [ubiquinone] 1 alpha subcomplex assembly factor 3 [Orchesella cincta]
MAVPRSLLSKLNIANLRLSSPLLLKTSSCFQQTYCAKRLSPPPLENYVHQRYFHYSFVRHTNKSYDPDGKTTVTILNDESGAPLMIDSYNHHGFKLNNGMAVLGPMVIFPRTVLGWDVSGIEDVTPESLALFSVLEPRPDVLVIGIGDKGAKLPIETLQFLRRKKFNIEVLATEHACTTFNFLSGEGRCTAAVMLPPHRIVWTSQDLANTKRAKKKLYEDED